MFKEIDKNILEDVENITNEKYDENTSIDDILVNLLQEIEIRDEKIRDLEIPECERFYPAEEYGY